MLVGNPVETGEIMDRQSDFSGCRGCHPFPGTGWDLCYLGAGPFSSPVVSCLYLPAPPDVAGAPESLQATGGLQGATGGKAAQSCSLGLLPTCRLYSRTDVAGIRKN